MNDHRLLAATLDAIVVERPEPTEHAPQHLCLDKGYDDEPSRQALEERGYVEHIRPTGLERPKDADGAAGEKRHPARRWVVERTFSWLCRAVPLARRPGPLGQEAAGLPRRHQARLRAPLVPQGVARGIGTFEIDFNTDVISKPVL